MKKQEVPKGINSADLKTINIAKMKSYFNNKHFQDVFPIIVCFCPDIQGGSCNDLAELVSDKEYSIPEKVYAIALWKFKRILCLYDNPSGKKIQWKSDKLEEFFSQK